MVQRVAPSKAKKGDNRDLFPVASRWMKGVVGCSTLGGASDNGGCVNGSKRRLAGVLTSGIDL